MPPETTADSTSDIAPDIAPDTAADPSPAIAPIRFGWEEWLALPDLGLPALKVKIDTGAKTSALHAFDIEPFGPAARPKVRFAIHPVPGRDDLTIACSALITDRREVTSSNGEAERRYVIETTLRVGDASWPIEVTLTDRANMAYRMLVGRQALTGRVAVLPGEGFLQPELSYDIYGTARLKRATPARALRIAVLSRMPHTYSTRRLVEEGESRGHVIEVIDTERCYMSINSLAPEVHCDGARLPRFDAVIPRIGASFTPYGASVVRQFETLGTYCVNGSQGLTSSRDKLQAHQILARSRIGMPATAFAASPKDTDNLMGLVGSAPMIVKLLDSVHGAGVVLAETRKAAQSVIDAFRGLRANFLVQQFVKEAAGEEIRCVVVAGRVVASLKRTGTGEDFRSHRTANIKTRATRISPEERQTAVRAARAFGMGMASVDMLRSDTGPKVLDVNASPGLEGVERATGKNIAALILDGVEKRVRQTPAARR